MIYNILSIADLHWGIKDPNTQYDNLESFIIFIEEFKDIDMIVISGDYFETRLPLNSTPAITAIQWMYYLIETAKKVGVKKIRVIKGTREHDNDQLEAFRSLETEDGFFKIFNENTYEETLPELGCLYCPDENINSKDYIEKYANNILNYPNIGFFHGSFDVVLPDIVVQLSEETSAKSIIFEYAFWSKIIKGPMIAGHWHDGCIIDDLIYLGSPDRWAFGEEEEKGFGLIRMNTDTNEYFFHKIINNSAPIYKTVDIHTHLFNTIEDYNILIKSIDDMLKDNTERKRKVRILINITDSKSINDNFITSIRHYFVDNKDVKITIKNKLKSEQKKEEKKKNIEIRSKFNFIFDKGLDEAKIIQEYILSTKDKEIPLEVIKKFINKYIAVSK